MSKPFEKRFVCPRCGRPVKKNKVLQSQGGYAVHKDCKPPFKCSNRRCRGPVTWDPYKRRWVCARKCTTFVFSEGSKEYVAVSRRDYTPHPHRDIQRSDFYKQFPDELRDPIDEAIRWDGKSPEQIIQEFQL